MVSLYNVMYMYFHLKTVMLYDFELNMYIMYININNIDGKF